MRRISNVSEALRFLRGLEEQSRWDHKYVVLDCSADMAKEIVVSHVRDATLGRRTYHYLLSGLVSLHRETKREASLGVFINGVGVVGVADVIDTCNYSA